MSLVLSVSMLSMLSVLDWLAVLLAVLLIFVGAPLLRCMGDQPRNQEEEPSDGRPGAGEEPPHLLAAA